MSKKIVFDLEEFKDWIKNEINDNDYPKYIVRDGNVILHHSYPPIFKLERELKLKGEIIDSN